MIMCSFLPLRAQRVTAAAALALAASIAGCSSGHHSGRNGSVNDVTMTPAEADAYAEKLMLATGAGLHPKPRLEFSPYFSGTTGCPGGPDASQMVVASRVYWLRDITEHDNIAIGEQILRYWKSLHWSITDSGGIGTSQPRITAVAPPYAFSVDLGWSTNGALSIGASSVCLWPDGHRPGGH
jgi:hypothetical protein